MRELVMQAELVHYRRECWVMPDGRTVIASMPVGIKGGYGANLRRFCLVMHAQGQVTTKRLTALLNDIGIDISKRQVVRLLTTDLDRLAEEDAAILHAGLVSAAFITVDDTGARHAIRNFYTTQIGGEFFTAFRTGPSKSRLNFLSLMRANYQDYVINDATLDYLERRRVEPALVAKLQTQQPQLFGTQFSFLNHLAHKGIDLFDAGLIRILGEAGMWGTIRHHGLLGNTVIISDDAGQFRVANHALCWVHSDRLLQKLMPATPRQVQQVDAIRDLVWCFYQALKAWKLKPSPGMANAFRHRFDRIFSIRTGYADLNKLLARLYRRKDELLKVLDHPDIPLHTNAQLCHQAQDLGRHHEP